MRTRAHSGDSRRGQSMAAVPTDAVDISIGLLNVPPGIRMVHTAKGGMTRLIHRSGPNGVDAFRKFAKVKVAPSYQLHELTQKPPYCANNR